MTTVVDIYIKLIIAVLGFVAPTVTLLFPVFFKGITIIKEKLLVQENQFEELIQTELATIDTSLASVETLGLLDAKTIREKFKKDRIKRQHQATNDLSRSLYYFELKEQIKWIFVPLFLALVYVMLYAVVKENVFNMMTQAEVESLGKDIIIIHAIVLILTTACIFIRIKVTKFNKNLSPWATSNNLKWIFLTLPVGIISLLAYFCICDNWFDAKEEFIKIHIETFILLMSLLMFFFSIRRLWRIACTVIDAKPMLDSWDQERSSSQVPRNVPNGGNVS